MQRFTDVRAWASDIKYKVVSNLGKNTTHEVIAAVTGSRIAVVCMWLCVDGGTVLAGTWKSATTAITGALRVQENNPVVLTYNPAGWFRTAAGEALQVTTDNPADTPTLEGVIGYVELAMA